MTVITSRYCLSRMHQTLVCVGWLLGVALIGVSTAATSATSGHCLADNAALNTVSDAAQRFEQLRTLHLALDGELVLAEGFRGISPRAATNVKSASKTLIAAVVGAAIEQGVIEGIEQRVTATLPAAVPAQASSLLDQITVGHLLSMQAGLRRTSGEYYGAWIARDHWVKAVLDQPMAGKPGGEMRYSTGNTHLLSAILQQRTGEASYALANRWLAPAGVQVANWMTDPQGIAFGGNQVAMRPAALLALGELYRRDGLAPNGARLLPEGWVAQSWQVRGRSRWTHDGYGYGWFIRDFAGYAGYYGWGYGGQMLYVIPDLAMTLAITSETDSPSGRTGYRDALHAYTEDVVRVVERAEGC